MNLTKRFSIFGVSLMWSALIPLYFFLISQNTFIQVLGAGLMVGWYIVFKRCNDLDLMFVMVKKTSSAWASTPLAVSWFVAIAWVLWYANDERGFLWAWAITATTATLRMLIEVETNNVGEQA
jgi:hypothetical protein